MFSVKKNVLQTVALIKAYGIRHIVLSPGSRNAPLIHTFSQDPFFTCHTILDERNAAFYAIGIIQALQEPVVICCTSGSALLNYAPAVSEAYYQQLPLIVISADRSPEWIGQMDGQTFPQANVFGSLSKKSVNLPEVKSETDEWFCNRLINEALISSTAKTWGPVHINIPLSEPLFDYSEKELPRVRKINHVKANKSTDIVPFVTTWKSSAKRLIIVGQSFYNKELLDSLENLTSKNDCVVLVEHLSNCKSDDFIDTFDTIISKLNESDYKNLAPDIVISLGGHIISKRLKQFIRQNKPIHHWLISESKEVVDLFQCLTDIIETDSSCFINDLSQSIDTENDRKYFQLWKAKSLQIKEPLEDENSDISAIGAFLKNLPNGANVHLANSSTVRHAQLFSVEKSINFYCNRGINGIEGSLPTAIGFASVSDDPVYLIIGDLSFFYSVNSLWNMEHISNLRILLINNGSGAIFHTLPGLKDSNSVDKYVAMNHRQTAEEWCKPTKVEYIKTETKTELNTYLEKLNKRGSKRSLIIEYQNIKHNTNFL